MKFRKKPVVIEAWQNVDDVSWPNWLDRVEVRRAPGGVVLIKTLEGTMKADPFDWIIKGVKGELYPCKPDIFQATYDVEPVEPASGTKDLGITEVRGAKANISDLVVYGDGDTFALLCKASSKDQGWMKSTKVANVPSGCIVQVTTQQKNPDGSYVVAEALTFVPDVNIDVKSDPRRLVKVGVVE